MAARHVYRICNEYYFFIEWLKILHKCLPIPGNCSIVVFYQINQFSNIMAEAEHHDEIDRELENAMRSVASAGKKKAAKPAKDSPADKPAKKKAKIVKEKDPLVKIFEDDHDNYCSVHTEDIPRLRSWACTPEGDDHVAFTLDFGSQHPVRFCVPKANASACRKSFQNIRRKYFPIISNGEEAPEERQEEHREEPPARESTPRTPDVHVRKESKDQKKRKAEAESDSETGSDSDQN